MADPTCSIENCDRLREHREWCGAHYQRWLRGGDPVGTGKPPIVRRKPERHFWDYVQKTDGCWLWMGPTLGNGYGTFAIAGRLKRTFVHRLAYEELVGPIPPGLVIDHLCRVRHCVNPAHLEPVTNAENILRGTGASARNARKTHCPQGHPYSPENTYLRRNGHARFCRTCAIRKSVLRKQQIRARRREAA